MPWRERANHHLDISLLGYLVSIPLAECLDLIQVESYWGYPQGTPQLIQIQQGWPPFQGVSCLQISRNGKPTVQPSVWMVPGIYTVYTSFSKGKDLWEKRRINDNAIFPANLRPSHACPRKSSSASSKVTQEGCNSCARSKCLRIDLDDREDEPPDFMANLKYLAFLWDLDDGESISR